MLDPSRGSKLALPPDDELTGDLTAPHWRVLSGGKIKLETKDDIRSRIGRSTDHGDAVIQAYWISGVSWMDAYGVVRCDHCDRAFPKGSREMCPYSREPLDGEAA